jgi:hypothetical protein
MLILCFILINLSGSIIEIALLKNQELGYLKYLESIKTNYMILLNQVIEIIMNGTFMTSITTK